MTRFQGTPQTGGISPCMPSKADRRVAQDGPPWRLRSEFIMSKFRTTVLAMLLAGTALGAAAQTAAEHAQHHPEGAAAAATAPAAQPATPPNAMGPGQMANMTRMDQHMQAMRAMHDKMAAASTPEERQALMAEHLKLMQEGMGMMQQMGAGRQGMGGQAGMGPMGGMAAGKGMPTDFAARHQMMEKRMEMMESMLQMMMDRLPPAK